MNQDAKTKVAVQQAEAKKAVAEKAVAEADKYQEGVSAKAEANRNPTDAEKAAAESQLKATIQDSGKAKKAQQIEESKQEERRKAMYAAAAKGDAEVKRLFGEKAVGGPEHVAAKQRMAKAKATGRTQRDLIADEDRQAQDKREKPRRGVAEKADKDMRRNIDRHRAKRGSEKTGQEGQAHAKKTDTSKVEKAEVKKPMSNVERAKARRAQRERNRDNGLCR